MNFRVVTRIAVYTATLDKGREREVNTPLPHIQNNPAPTKQGAGYFIIIAYAGLHIQ